MRLSKLWADSMFLCRHFDVHGSQAHKGWFPRREEVVTAILTTSRNIQHEYVTILNPNPNHNPSALL